MKRDRATSSTSPLPCGERSDCGTIRVRGRRAHFIFRTCGSSPSPQPSPRKRRERGRTESSSMRSFQSVSVIGAGAWGTALAGVAARAGRDVILYARSPESAAQIEATRANPKLSGARLEDVIDITSDIARAARADIILIATPAQNLREAAALAPHLAAGTPVIACAKGIERGTHKFMTEVIAETAPMRRRRSCRDRVSRRTSHAACPPR